MSHKVLVLHGFDPIVKHISADTTADVEVRLFPATSEYSPEEPLLAFLRALQPDAYDLIIIGNNQGAGFTKAAVLPEALRSRAVIVWNDEPGTRTLKYKDRGYEHFTRMSKLLSYLDDNPQVYTR